MSHKWLTKRTIDSKRVSQKKYLKSKVPSCTPDFFKNDDFIDRLITEKKNKEEYFLSVQDQERIFKSIMNQSNNPYLLLKSKLH